jgi:multiple sugar transport system substrate-binding protein
MSRNAVRHRAGTPLGLAIWLLCLALLIGCRSREITLELGIFAGSNWGVPSGDSYKLYDEAIALFEKENPGIKVHYRSGTLRDDYSEWLAQRIVRGNDPDVMVVLAEDFNTYASIGVMEPLDERIAADPDFIAGDFYQTALEAGKYQSVQFALPMEIVPNLMFVNKTVLEEAGVASPAKGWTWEDFYRICKKVTRDTDGDHVLDRFGATRFSWRFFMFADGLVPFDPTGTKAYFDTPGFVRTINFVSQMHKLSENQQEPGFDSGKVAFAPDRFSMYRAYKYYPYRINKFAQFNWEAIEMPKGPDGRNSSELSSLLLSVSRRSSRKEAAWKFLKFLATDPRTQLSILQYSHGWPALKKAASTPQASELLRKNFAGTEKNIDVQVIDSIIENSVVAPRFKKYDAAMDAADKELYRIIEEPFDLEDRLYKLNRTINASLK